MQTNPHTFNPYGGGHLSAVERAARLIELRAELEDAAEMLLAAEAAGDDEAAKVWRDDVERIAFALDITPGHAVALVMK